jgi:hypothetical protein
MLSFEVQCSRFRVEGFRFRVQGVGSKVWRFEFSVWGLGSRVEGRPELPVGHYPPWMTCPGQHGENTVRERPLLEPTLACMHPHGGCV